MKRLLALFLALVLPAAAAAEPLQVKTHYIPIGTVVEYLGERYQGFTFEEYKIVLSVDLQLYAASQRVKDLEEEVLAHEDRFGVMERLVGNLTDANAILLEENSRLYDRDNQLAKDLMKAQQPSPGPWVVLAVGAGLALFGVGLTIGSIKE